MTSNRKIIFITGTDTGVGKTLLTALLLCHLRRNGVKAIASKPFCSGGRGDVRLLQSLQAGELSDAEMNPFYFQKPVAPLVELQEKGREIRLKQVVAHLGKLSKKTDVLLVEGSGGLMVPLGKNFMVRDVVAALDCEIIVVCRNKLGTINHTLLTLKALQTLGISQGRISVVMMNQARKDVSSASNSKMIRGLVDKIPVFELPYLGKNLKSGKKVIEMAQKNKNELGEIEGWKD